MPDIKTPYRDRIMPLDAEQYSLLEANITREGCRDPLVLWGDKLLDGHNRLDICTEHGIGYRTVQLKPAPANEKEALHWMDVQQLGRRNLRADHLAIVRGRLYNYAKSLPQPRTPRDHFDHTVGSAEELAAKAGVSAPTVRRDGKLVERLESEAPDKLEAVRKGKTTLRAVRKELRDADNERKTRNAPKPKPPADDPPPEGVSANPEDYTSRGRIITPLKDRFDVQIRTHYPVDLEHEIDIMEQEASPLGERSQPVTIPQFMKEVLGNLTFEARKSTEINQSSGVSVRVTINNYESMISNAEKRALRLGETEIVPRVSDLHAVLPSTGGKIEIEYVGEDRNEEELMERLLNRAILKTFDERLDVNGLQNVVDYFNSGWGVEVSDTMGSADYLEGIKEIPGLKEAISSLGDVDSPAFLASATEFVLEGLHLHQKLNKESVGGRITYAK